MIIRVIKLVRMFKRLERPYKQTTVLIANLSHALNTWQIYESGIELQ